MENRVYPTPEAEIPVKHVMLLPMRTLSPCLALAAVALWPGALLAQQTAAVDPQSLMTTPVYLFNGANEISQGTGFFYANMKPSQPGKAPEVETLFLVTNYHVVTGHAPGLKTARSGDRIRFAFHADPNDLENIRIWELPLYDFRDDPVWAQSESFAEADVVLVPIPARMYAQLTAFYVFTEAHTRTDLKIRPTSGATLLGYPYGFYDKKHLLPIWKTGHIASEPDVDFEGEPTFLVDVSAFPGMSGSPVLAAGNGIYESEEGVMRSGRVTKLLGVFSSMPVVHRSQSTSINTSADRAAPADISLQLGYVWKASLIADIARHYQDQAKLP